MNETSDVSLLQAWVEKKDAEAFTTLVWRHSGMVYGTCRRILRNGTDAEDVAQECFITLAGHRDPICQSLGGWLHTVATRRSLNRIRAENRRKDRDTTYTDQERNSTRAVMAGWDEIRGLVDEAIAALPERLRYPVIAHFLEGQTHAAIADTLGVSQPSVTRYIKKGVEEIRSALVSRRVEISASSLAAVMAAKALVDAPEALAANLGKLALAGNEALPPMVTATAAQGIPKGAGYVGGLLLMKAKFVAVAVVLIVAVVAGYFLVTGPEETIENRVADSSIATELEPREVLGTVPVDSADADVPDIVDEAAFVEDDESIEVTASSEDLSPSPVDADDTTAPNPDEVMPLEVSGVVVDTAGQSIAGAVVFLADSNRVIGQGDGLNDLAIKTSTNELGEFSFSVDALEGTYAVSVTADGYESTGTYFEFTRDESPADIEIVLREGFLLTGRVLTMALVPVTDATVRAFGFVSGTAASYSGRSLSYVFADTDNQGYFEIGFDGFGGWASSKVSGERASW
jgi:RNA polymerase sigma factor (sigma-70 family)